MSSHSRLGKGLGSLFPTLQQDAPKAQNNQNGVASVNPLLPPIPRTADVSRETSRNIPASNATTVASTTSSDAAAVTNHVSRETSDDDAQKHENQSAFEKHQKSQRPKIPSLVDSLHPADLFFGLDSDDDIPARKKKQEAESRNADASGEAKATESDSNKSDSSVPDSKSRGAAFREGDSASADVADSHAASQGRQASDAAQESMNGASSTTESGNGSVPGNASKDGKDFTPLNGAYYTELPLDSIAPNEHQPRTIFDEDDLRELADSIKEVGVLEPVVVRTRDNWTAPYELIMGERRLRAAKIAGLDKIPALVRTTSDNDMLRDAVLENLHRVALNPLEEAAAYQQMIDDFHITQAQLAQSVSKSRSQITNTLRLLQLPASVQKKVAAGVLSAGHARALLALSDPKQMEQLANRIIAEGLSVRSAEEIVAMKNGAETKQHRKAKPSIWQGSDELKRLEDRFETKVDIRGTRKRGKIEITFSSEADLKRIMDLIGVGDQPAGGAENGWV